MDVARCNFSHSTYEDHEKRMNEIKAIRTELNKPVGILLDTKGPEIRLGDFEEGKVELVTGQTFTLTTKDMLGTKDIVSITYKELYQDVKKGNLILIDDGLIEMEVIDIVDTDIICLVKNNGKVSNHKGVNVPGANLSMPYMSTKDQSDILFGITQDVDFIAASFVRSAEDVKSIRELLNTNGGDKINIIAKIENSQGVSNIDEIIAAADGIMIARGDMGVEIALEEVPAIQKMIIKKVYEAGKQVITATQMLESMIKNPRPTRAEATDVANAVYDGTSAIMLSGETAAGKYPVEALQTMIKIAEKTEQDIDYRKRFFHHERIAAPDITDAVCHATCTLALDLNAKAIVTVTKSGYAARMISRYRPACDIIGCTTNLKVSRQINLSWGVRPLVVKEESDVLTLFDHALDYAVDRGLLEIGDVAVITSGVPLGISGTTNMIKAQVVQK